MTPDIQGNADTIPQRVTLNRLYLWPGNPRHLSLDWNGQVADAEIKVPKVQAQCVLRVREADGGHHLMGIASSIGLYGLLGNPGAPIAVCSLGEGDFLVIDGNARVVALRDFLDDDGWCHANADYVQKLRAGIVVMDFGAWADRESKMAVLAQTASVHMGGHP